MMSLVLSSILSPVYNEHVCAGMEWEGPPKQGLYDPQNEHEACGVGFVVAIDGKRTHKVSIVLLMRWFLVFGSDIQFVIFIVFLLVKIGFVLKTWMSI